MDRREVIKNELKRVSSNLKSMSEDLEKLYNEMDDLSEEKFDRKLRHILNIYDEYGIELY